MLEYHYQPSYKRNTIIVHLNNILIPYSLLWAYIVTYNEQFALYRSPSVQDFGMYYTDEDTTRL